MNISERIITNKGSDAVIVYNIRYIPANKRSGWYPQLIIRSKVGINLVSNKI